MGKRKIEPEVKVEAVQEFLDGKSSQRVIADRLGISLASFQMWVKNYKSMGADAFSHNGNKHYSIFLVWVLSRIFVKNIKFHPQANSESG